jgi:hypothetical protein
MVLFLKGKVSDRKLRPYLCAGARLYWEAMTDLRSRQAVEIGERFADGLVGRTTPAGRARLRSPISRLPSPLAGELVVQQQEVGGWLT